MVFSREQQVRLILQKVMRQPSWHFKLKIQEGKGRRAVSVKWGGVIHLDTSKQQTTFLEKGWRFFKDFILLLLNRKQYIILKQFTYFHSLKNMPSFPESYLTWLSYWVSGGRNEMKKWRHRTLDQCMIVYGNENFYLSEQKRGFRKHTWRSIYHVS